MSAVAPGGSGMSNPRSPFTGCSQCGATFGPGDSGYSHCIDHAPVTKVQRNRELTDLLPLEPTRDDLVFDLLPLVPECTRPTYGDCGRRGVCAA